jgi:hypothetical protein
MVRLKYLISINAPAVKVFDIMLGISKKSTYQQWTALFNPTSTYEGNWEKDSKILFVGTNEKGEKEGMVSEIVENIPNQFISIRHYGLVQANEEITSGPDVEKWANGNENYTFDESNEITTLKIELDTTEEFVEYMNEAYPKALEMLKSICEN